MYIWNAKYHEKKGIYLQQDDKNNSNDSLKLSGELNIMKIINEEEWD